MKTAISIPDKVFDAADSLARELGLSRSELYSRAVHDYLEKHEQRTVTETLNRVYTDVDSTLDPALQSMQSLSVTNPTTQPTDGEDW